MNFLGNVGGLMGGQHGQSSPNQYFGASQINQQLSGLTNIMQQQAGALAPGRNRAPYAGPPKTAAEKQQQAATLIPGTVCMFSGCKDSQTSADVSDVSSFGVAKPASAADKAGGACTNALLATVAAKPQTTFADLLLDMQSFLSQRKYTQVPQLSSSKPMNLRNHQWSLQNAHPNGRTKALLVGINYHGHAQGELSGCINDVKQMCGFLDKNNFATTSDRRRILCDAPGGHFSQMPTGQNMMAGIQWLVQDCQPGDSLFFHYSGHGTQIPDDDGDEEDGLDEALCPVDYPTGGCIRDDTLFKAMVATLKEGVNLVCVFDCCHSGSIMDLPYNFVLTQQAAQQIQSGGDAPIEMPFSPSFNFDHVVGMFSQVQQGLFNGFAEVGSNISSVGKGNGLNLLF